MEQKEFGRQMFDLESDSLVLKEIISKDFLKVELWAVSDDNPNNNYSHFVSENFKDNMPSFYEKPILGYYKSEDDDFKAHEGKNVVDKETGVEYWDNYNGERILGFIRHNDKVEVRERDGKKWIVVTAALWTHYNFREIKKIVKDKKKKISVEINVEDAYFTDLDGNILNAISLNEKHVLTVINDKEEKVQYKFGQYIEHITQFALEGITILGSKFGKPIKEGIEGASLSLLSEDGKAMFSRQQQALCFAYQELDNQAESVEANIIKEDNGEMDSQDLGVSSEPTVNEGLTNFAEEENKEENKPEENRDEQETKNQELNSEVIDHSAECEDHGCDENHENEDCHNENESEDNEDENASGDGCKENEDCHDEKECGGPMMSAEEDDNKDEEEGSKEQCAANESEVDGHKEGCAKSEESDDKDKDEEDSEEEDDDENSEDYSALNQKYEEAMHALEECQEALATQKEKFNEQSTELEKVKNDCASFKESSEKYEAENAELKKAVFEMTAEKRVSEAKLLLSQIEIPEAKRTEILENCQSGKYNESYEELRKTVAVSYFDNSCKNSKIEGFSISIPAMNSNVSTTKKSKTTSYDRLKNYLGK